MNFLIALLVFLITNPILSQEINISDKNGNKQGKWKKYFKNGNTKYEGQFIDCLLYTSPSPRDPT